MTVTHEVSKSDMTLMGAIEHKVVPKPPLMQWNKWQAWRKRYGMRPTTATDGGTTLVRQEVALHRSTMRALYGEDWEYDLAEQIEDDEDAGDAAAVAKAKAKAAPKAEVAPAATPRGPLASLTGPDSGPSAAAPVVGVRSPPKSHSPGSGIQDSWRSSQARLARWEGGRPEPTIRIKKVMKPTPLV